MVKHAPAFPVRGVPGGWQDEWSAPDPAAAMRQQLAAWEAARLERLAQLRPADAKRGATTVMSDSSREPAASDSPPA